MGFVRSCRFSPKIRGQERESTPVSPQGTWDRVWGRHQRVKSQGGPKRKFWRRGERREIPGIPRVRIQEWLELFQEGFGMETPKIHPPEGCGAQNREWSQSPKAPGGFIGILGFWDVLRRVWGGIGCSGWVFPAWDVPQLSEGAELERSSDPTCGPECTPRPRQEKTPQILTGSHGRNRNLEVLGLWPLGLCHQQGRG